MKNLRVGTVWCEWEAWCIVRPGPDRLVYPLSVPCLLVLGSAMKNLAISGTWSFSIPGSNLTTTVVDVDRACLWITSERLNADADTEVDIYKKGLADDSDSTEDVSASLMCPMDRYHKTMQAHFLRR